MDLQPPLFGAPTGKIASKTNRRGGRDGPAVRPAAVNKAKTKTKKRKNTLIQKETLIYYSPYEHLTIGAAGVEGTHP